MRSGGRRAVAAALLAGVAFAWPTYVRYCGLRPGALLAALLIAFAMYLPSLWAIRLLDRHEREPPLLFWCSVAFVIMFAPITSRVMHAIIDGGLLPYWVVVGPPCAPPSPGAGRSAPRATSSGGQLPALAWAVF